METALWIGLAVLSAGVLVLAFGLYVTLGAGNLNSPAAFVHDGPKPGRRIPPIEVTTTRGDHVALPDGGRRLLLFTDHSLIDFPELVELLSGDLPPDLPDVLVLARTEASTPDVLDGLGLRVPVALVSQQVYDSYRVRVMPYGVIVRADGRAGHSGLVNTAYQLRRLALEPGGAAVAPVGGDR